MNLAKIIFLMNFLVAFHMVLIYFKSKNEIKLFKFFSCINKNIYLSLKNTSCPKAIPIHFCLTYINPRVPIIYVDINETRYKLNQNYDV